MSKTLRKFKRCEMCGDYDESCRQENIPAFGFSLVVCATCGMQCGVDEAAWPQPDEDLRRELNF